MNAIVQGQIELSAVLNLIPYLDTKFNYDCEMSLSEIIAANDEKFANNGAFQIMKAAVEQNPSYGEVVLVDQSSTNGTAAWTDDLIQGCTFKDPAGNYYVAYRGTGNGRWADNGDGMTAQSTEMQEAARKYFDSMAEKYFVGAKEAGKQIIVTGHSKGGNEAQYVYMASEYEHLIDNCYSYDGQGFSGSAREHFMEQYGSDYERKLSNMYSICGEDDFVHDLGYVIIPEENTYFVKTSESGFASFHALENMIGNHTDGYTGLQWNTEDGAITRGEQGEIGKLAKKISETMMKLDSENLHGAAIALMSFFDLLMGNDSLGSTEINWTDYIDLTAHGLPALLETVLFTEEGNAALDRLIRDGTKQLYDKYGPGGVFVGFAAGGAVLILVAPVAAQLLFDVVVVSKILDFAIDTIDRMKEISDKIKNYILDIKEYVEDAIQRIVRNITSGNAGDIYVTANPQLALDPTRLHAYAQRVRDVNRRISGLDRRMDSLYWQVGFLDLWNLLQADLLTGYSWKLARCEAWLDRTADDFETAEQSLLRVVQEG